MLFTTGRFPYIIGRMKKRVSIIGCGRWGTCLAWYMAAKTEMGKPGVLLYGRQEFEDYRQLKKTRKNSYLTLPDNVEMIDDLNATLSVPLVIISVGTQVFRTLCKEIAPYKSRLKNTTFLLAMKGLEHGSAKTISDIWEEEVGVGKLSVLAGPGHVQDYLSGTPTVALIDSSSDIKIKLAHELSSPLIRMYYGEDFIGTQIGAALKNVVGIAAGILDGLNWQGLKGGLMVRAPIEIGNYITARGGKARSAYGLSHLGDYEATLFSPHSHNRLFGENFARGKKIDPDKLAEGYYTLKAVNDSAKKLGVDMPIIKALYRAIYKGADIKKEIATLFSRDIKPEFR